ncbi:MAG: DUF6036 family nucleotidyltransferase [Thermincolia bacterium]
MQSIMEEIKTINDPQQKLLRFMAYLTNNVRNINPLLTPVIVGGSAVFIYTFGGHLTYDIDLVVTDRQAVTEVLSRMGFQQGADIRHWYHDDLDMAIEIPDDVLAGDNDKITIIEIDNSEVYVIGIEDLLIDRLCAAKHWKSGRDEAQSLSLLELYSDEIDMNYLEERARAEEVLDKLDEVRKKLKF